MMTARRRARTMVLSAPLTLLALNAGLVLWVEYRPDLRDPLYYSKEDKLAERLAEPVPDRLVVVALGSSRMGNGFHPPTVEEEVTAATGRPCLAFNAAVLGRGPMFQMLQLRRLLARGIHPDVVVVEVVPSMFAAPGGAPAELGHLRSDRLTRAEIDELAAVGFDDPEFRADWLKAMANPIFSFRTSLLGRVEPKWTPGMVVAEPPRFPNPTGWQPWREPVTPASYEAGVRFAGSHKANLEEMEVGSAGVAALRAVLADCRRAGVTAVVVLNPEASDFRSWYGPGARAATDELLAIAREGADGRVADARAWMPDEAFADPHHLTAAQAKVYTARLARELIAPAARARSAGAVGLAGR